ncbi:MAG: shikimate dehydrogenase, partial [Acidimicrobiales bacterium]
MTPGATLGASTRLAGVIGHPVSHSLSPALHNAAFDHLGLDWAFAAFDVAPGRAGAALDAARALGLGGLSVTTPHK